MNPRQVRLTVLCKVSRLARQRDRDVTCDTIGRRNREVAPWVLMGRL